jgi:hypothetical protein
MKIGVGLMTIPLMAGTCEVPNHTEVRGQSSISVNFEVPIPGKPETGASLEELELELCHELDDAGLIRALRHTKAKAADRVQVV